MRRFNMEIDCRGKACPQPVITAKQALEQFKEDEFVLVVDNPGSSENVERFARSQGCSVQVTKKDGDYYLRIGKPQTGESTASLQEGEKARKTVAYINSQFLGIGDDALGAILMRAFMKTLLEMENKPGLLIFINSGVKLTSEGSEVLESLRALAGKGVEILSCGTCLDFYGLKEKLRVGIVSNMYDIARSLLEADTIIRP
jgi:selenium metabolism protein YedF